MKHKIMENEINTIDSIFNLIRKKIKLSENAENNLQYFIINIATKKPITLFLKSLKAYLETIKTTSEKEISLLLTEIESIMSRDVRQIKRVFLKSDLIQNPNLKYYFDPEITYICTDTMVQDGFIFTKNQLVEIEKIETENKYIAYPQFAFISEFVFKNCFKKFIF